MLHKIDSLYGHVIEDTDQGPIYQDDKSLVDFQNPRPCLGCKAKIQDGEHDPCIGNLSGVYQACCGHGLESAPRNSGKPAGYAALKDGRCIRFSGCIGASKIREAVEAALNGASLPDGVELDHDRMWWEGLTDVQCQYVKNNIPRGLAELVRQAKKGDPPSERFLKGEAMWWDGLTEEEKQFVLVRMKAMLAELVQEALERRISE